MGAERAAIPQQAESGPQLRQVAQRICEAYGDSKDLRSPQQSFERAPGSHTFALEERRVSGLSAPNSNLHRWLARELSR